MSVPADTLRKAAQFADEEPAVMQEPCSPYSDGQSFQSDETDRRHSTGDVKPKGALKRSATSAASMGSMTNSELKARGESRKQILQRRADRKKTCTKTVDKLVADGFEDLEVKSYNLAFNAIAQGEETPKQSEKPGSVHSSRQLSGEPFSSLLQQLGAEHEREILVYQQRVEKLQADLTRLRGSLADGQPALSPKKCVSDSQTVVNRTSPSGSLISKDIMAQLQLPELPGSVASCLPTLPAENVVSRETEKEEALEASHLTTMMPTPLSPTVKVVSLLSPRPSPRGSSQGFHEDLHEDLPLDLHKEGSRQSFSAPSLSQQDSDLRSDESEYRVHMRWLKERSGIRGATVIPNSMAVQPMAMGATTPVDESGNLEPKPADDQYEGWMRPFIRYPSSPRQVSWDLVGAVLILYDLVAIPLKVFDPPDNTFTIFIDWFALIFWTLNMFASLTVGYLDDGKYVLNPVLILRQYMRFWFWIDLAVVAPDWTFTLVSAVSGATDSSGESVKLLRILRLIRCMRLLRLGKLKWIVASIKDLINSESVDIVFSICKMILCLVAVVHVLACFWFGTTLIDAGPSWVQYHQFDNADWSYQYVTSFHWAITQFTPSSMHVQPQNIYERSFTILVVLAGLVGFSYLVGSITGSLAELRRMKEDAVKQFWNLRRFLKKSQVPMPLRIRIEKYLEHAWQLQKDSVTNGNLPILRLLTEQLRNELNCAMSMPHREVQPLFEYLWFNSAVAMQRIATKALSRKLLARGESNFHAGELAQHLGFVVAGRLQYNRHFSDHDDEEDHTEMVDKGEDWITEPALWMPEWMTLGELVAVSVSELLEVSATEFADAIKRTPQVMGRVCIYAANFVKYMNDVNDGNRKELSDICQGDVIGTEIEHMLVDHEANENIDEILNHTKKSGWATELTSKSHSKSRHADKSGTSAFGWAKSKTQTFLSSPTKSN